MKADLLQNGKTDTNNNGAFSTDYIGGSYEYPEGSYATRAQDPAGARRLHPGLHLLSRQGPARAGGAVGGDEEVGPLPRRVHRHRSLAAPTLRPRGPADGRRVRHVPEGHPDRPHQAGRDRHGLVQQRLPQRPASSGSGRPERRERRGHAGQGGAVPDPLSRARAQARGGHQPARPGLFLRHARRVFDRSSPSASHTTTTTAASSAFGPDGYLYIGMGDGGGGGDPGNRAQNLDYAARQDAADRHQRHGRDAPVPHPDVAIPTSGGRPQRDLGARPAQSVELVVRPDHGRPVDRRRRPEPVRGDRPLAGQQQPGTAAGASTTAGGSWRAATATEPSSGCRTTGKKLPVVEYSHSQGCSVTGGYVYRGTAIPALVGQYVFADYCSGRSGSIPRTAVAPATKSLLRSRRCTSALSARTGG